MKIALIKNSESSFNTLHNTFCTNNQQVLPVTFRPSFRPTFHVSKLHLKSPYLPLFVLLNGYDSYCISNRYHYFRGGRMGLL